MRRATALVCAVLTSLFTLVVTGSPAAAVTTIRYDIFDQNDDPDQNAYTATLDAIASALPNRVDGVPLTSQQAGGYMTVTVNNGAAELTFVISTENLYVVGYYSATTLTYRYFSDSTVTTYPGARVNTNMGYSSNYNHLQGLGVSRSGLSVGPYALGLAVRGLAARPATWQEEAPHLLVVIQTLSEAARFAAIRQSILDGWFDPYQKLGDLLIQAQNQWSAISDWATGNEHPAPVNLRPWAYIDSRALALAALTVVLNCRGPGQRRDAVRLSPICADYSNTYVASVTKIEFRNPGDDDVEPYGYVDLSYAYRGTTHDWGRLWSVWHEDAYPQSSFTSNADYMFVGRDPHVCFTGQVWEHDSGDNADDPLTPMSDSVTDYAAQCGVGGTAVLRGDDGEVRVTYEVRQVVYCTDRWDYVCSRGNLNYWLQVTAITASQPKDEDDDGWTEAYGLVAYASPELLVDMGSVWYVGKSDATTRDVIRPGYLERFRGTGEPGVCFDVSVWDRDVWSADDHLADKSPVCGGGGNVTVTSGQGSVSVDYALWRTFRERPGS